MSKIKSDAISMVREGRLNVAENIVVIHENVSTGHLPSVFVYGVFNDKRIPLVYNYGATLTTGSIPADSWYEVLAILGGNLPDGADTGDVYYTKDALALGAGDSVKPLEAVETNDINPVGPLASIFSIPWSPCEDIYYELHDAERIASLYSVVINTRLPAEVHEEGD